MGIRWASSPGHEKATGTEAPRAPSAPGTTGGCELPPKHLVVSGPMARYSKKSDLEARIEALAYTFALQLLAAFKGASMEELATIGGRRPGRPRKVRRG